MSEPAVRVNNVSKRFRLGATQRSLGTLFLKTLAGLRRKGTAAPASHFWALRNVRFDVPAGGAIGVIGPNGAGKSTLLKLLAGILRPDGGRIEVRGRLAALIEIGAGFHGDLTGRENIFLSGAILGMSRREIRSKLDAIASFAGLERFLDMPVKRYSSGMYARLGFSIASHIEPEVLLVDEVLSVGDAVFRLRCLERMRQLVAAGTTLILVTHDLDQLHATCARTIVLEQGEVAFDGPSEEAIHHYFRAMTQMQADRPTDLPPHDSSVESRLRLAGLRFLDGNCGEVRSITPRDRLVVELALEARPGVEHLVVELNMRSVFARHLLSVNSARCGRSLAVDHGRHLVRLVLPALPVCGGQYFWNVRVWDGTSTAALIDTPFRFPLLVKEERAKTGIVSVEPQWSMQRVTAFTDDPGAGIVVSRDAAPDLLPQTAPASRRAHHTVGSVRVARSTGSDQR